MRRLPSLGGALLPLAFLLWDGVASSNAPAGHYTLTTNTALDNRTQLRWLRSYVEVGGTPSLTWAKAAQGCQALSVDGFTGWRLPSARELESLYDPRKTSDSRMIDETVFISPNTIVAQTFWSATPVASDATKIEARGFFSRAYNSTNRAPLDKDDFGGARCVRAP